MLSILFYRLRVVFGSCAKRGLSFLFYRLLLLWSCANRGLSFLFYRLRVVHKRILPTQLIPVQCTATYLKSHCLCQQRCATCGLAYWTLAVTASQRCRLTYALWCPLLSSCCTTTHYSAHLHRYLYPYELMLHDNHCSAHLHRYLYPYSQRAYHVGLTVNIQRFDVVMWNYRVAVVGMWAVRADLVLSKRS